MDGADFGKLFLPTGALGDSRYPFGSPGAEDVAGFASQMAASPSIAYSSSLAELPPGLPYPVGSPSQGSTFHGIGKCRPCAWFWKSSGCQKGETCSYCHLCPAGEIKARKKAKQTMMQLGLATPQPNAQLDPFRFPTFMMETEGTARRLAFGNEQDQALMDQHALASSSEPENPPGCSDQESTTTGETEHGAASGSEQEAAPNMGSSLHGTGKCKPCAWFWKSVGCQKGQDCGFCHRCPEGERKDRKKSKTAMMRLGLATPKYSPEAEAQSKQALSLASLL